jgi:AraC-like DNA-binding protein
MILKDFPPKAPLNEFIQCYRIIDFEFGGAENAAVKSYAPKPECVLHFILRDFWAIQEIGKQRCIQPPVVLLGQRTALVQQFTGRSFTGVQVIFQPSALFRLTGIPAYQLTDQHLDARDIFGPAITSYHERLLNAKSYAEMLFVIELFCTEITRRANPTTTLLDRISGQMVRKGSILTLQQLADHACLSSKQFRRRFYECIGVNPHTYSRVIRFNRAYNSKNAYPERDWLTIAIDFGYVDYQHLTKDYKEFTTHTPDAFHRLEGKSPERILGLTHSLYRERAHAAG